MLLLLPLLLACRDEAQVTVVSVRDLGPLPQPEEVMGRDGGYSVLFRDRSVWTFGDTILSTPGTDSSTWRNNTASFTGDLDASDGLQDFSQWEDTLGVPVEFLPRTDEEQAYNEAHAGEACQDPCGAREALWPSDAVYDQARDRVLVFYEKIHGEPGEWNFWGLGHGIAEWTDPDAAPVRPQVRPGEDEPTLHWGADSYGWGAAARIVDDHVYAFACETVFLSKPCRLARAPLGEALDPDAWSYWTGSGWSSQESDAAALFDGESQLSVHYNPFLDTWLAAYAVWTDNTVRFRTAPDIQGPWSREVTAFQGLAPGTGDFGIYCGVLHDEYMRENGRFELVSYYRGTTDWHGEVRLVEVEVQ